MKQILIMTTLWIGCQLIYFVTTIWCLLSILFGNKNRAWRMIVASDRLLNTATGGSDRETLSSRANRGRLEGRKGWCILCKLLDKVDYGHCIKSAGM